MKPRFAGTEFVAFLFIGGEGKREKKGGYAYIYIYGTRAKIGLERDRDPYYPYNAKSIRMTFEKMT